MFSREFFDLVVYMLQNTFLARYADLITDLYARSICERGNARVSNYLRGGKNVNGRLEIIHTGSLSFRVRKRARRTRLSVDNTSARQRVFCTIFWLAVSLTSARYVRSSLDLLRYFSYAVSILRDRILRGEKNYSKSETR